MTDEINANDVPPLHYSLPALLLFIQY